MYYLGNTNFMLECSSLHNLRKRHLKRYLWHHPNTIKLKKIFQENDCYSLNKIFVFWWIDSYTCVIVINILRALYWCLFFIVVMSFGLVCAYLLPWMCGQCSILYWDIRILGWIIEVDFEVLGCGHNAFGRIWLDTGNWIKVMIW